MTGLDLLGAEGLSSQYVTLRIRSLDVDKLKRNVGGVKGESVSAALPLADAAPKMALDVALPFITHLVKDKYGIDLEYAVSDAPPASRKWAVSGFYPGVAVGLGSAAAFWALWRFGISKLF